MNRLWVRLALAFLVVTWAVLGVVALVVYSSVQSSFRRYVNERDAALFGQPLIDDLVNYYARRVRGRASIPSWAQPGHGRSAGGRGPQTYVAEPDGAIVAATDTTWVGQRLKAIGPSRTTSLLLDGRRIGILGQQTPGFQALDEAEHNLHRQVNQVCSTPASLRPCWRWGVGILLSFNLTQPLRQLAGRLALDACHGRRAGAGRRQRRGAPARRKFTLCRNAWLRPSRCASRWRPTSPRVAHARHRPARAPEAMLDGVYPLDVEHVAVAYEQTLHLSRLVDDLRLLTQAEAGRLPLLELALAGRSSGAEHRRFEPLAQDAGIALRGEAAAGHPSIEGDRARLLQVFDNLLTNACAHRSRGRNCLDRNEYRRRRALRRQTGVIDAETTHLFDRCSADDARARRRRRRAEPGHHPPDRPASAAPSRRAGDRRDPL